MFFAKWFKKKIETKKISFKCIYCGSGCSAAEDHVGKPGTCKFCKHNMIVHSAFDVRPYP